VVNGQLPPEGVTMTAALDDDFVRLREDYHLLFEGYYFYSCFRYFWYYCNFSLYLTNTLHDLVPINWNEPPQPY
jgi:hypothetical protein